MVFLLFFLYILKRGELQQWVDILFYNPQPAPTVPAEDIPKEDTSGMSSGAAKGAAAGYMVGGPPGAAVGAGLGAVAGAEGQPLASGAAKGGLFGSKTLHIQNVDSTGAKGISLLRLFRVLQK